MMKLLCWTLATVVPAAAFAALPLPQIDGGKAVVATIHGASLTYYQLARGSSLTARVQGPGTLDLVLRSESGRSKTTPRAELDRKLLSIAEIPSGIDKDARVAGTPTSRASTLAVHLTPGAHSLKITWPSTAGAGGLVYLSVSEGLSPPGVVSADLSLGDLLSTLPEHPASPGAAKPAKGGVGETAPVTRTLSATPSKAETRPSSGPLAAPGPTAVVAAAGTSPAWDHVSLDLHLGAERSSESYTAPTTLGSAGLELAYWPGSHVPILAGVDERFSHQAYASRQRGLEGQGPARVDLDEQRLDVKLVSGYDFGPRMLKSGRLVALPMLGVHYLGLRNGAFPADLFGVDVMGRVRYSLSPGVSLSSGIGWTYNLLSPTSTSFVGAPKSHIGIEAGLWLPLQGSFALELAYRGDFLAFKTDLRASHGATLGFHSSF